LTQSLIIQNISRRGPLMYSLMIAEEFVINWIAQQRKSAIQTA
jgi:hypothetical protein